MMQPNKNRLTVVALSLVTLVNISSPSAAAPKSGASGENMQSISAPAWAGFGSGWPPPKSGNGVALTTVPAGAPSLCSRIALA